MVHVSLQENKSPSKQTYIFQSSPKVPWNKMKCKDKKAVPLDKIMFNRRLVKRQFFAHHPVSTAEKDSKAERDVEARRRAIARRKAQRRMILNLQSDLPPVEGRKHDSAQTEIYFEELVAHPVEVSAETQTELKLNRPKSPLYEPYKIGVDVATDIKPGDLITFDMEVGPLIEVLIGKTLDQALVEIMEEQEYADIKKKQREYIEMRNAELIEELRLQERDIRIKNEIKRRLIETDKVKQIENETRERVAAAVITRRFLSSIVPDVVHGLKESGYDPIQRDIEARFMPWLMDRVREEVRRIIDADKLASNILNDILKMRDEATLNAKSKIHESVTSIKGNLEGTSESYVRSFASSNVSVQHKSSSSSLSVTTQTQSLAPWESALHLQMKPE